MPAKRKRPLPSSRMVALLIKAKRELIAANGHVTGEDFERCWDEAWTLMIAERAWPHSTEHRRHWRVAMIATKSEARAAFLDRPTPFGTLAAGLTKAAANLQVELTSEDLPVVLLAAIRAGHEVVGDDRDRGRMVAA